MKTCPNLPKATNTDKYYSKSGGVIILLASISHSDDPFTLSVPRQVISEEWVSKKTLKPSSGERSDQKISVQLSSDNFNLALQHLILSRYIPYSDCPIIDEIGW